MERACAAFVAVSVFTTVLLSTSLRTLHSTELGIRANSIFQSVSPAPYSAGLHFVGPGGYFIKFRRTVMSAEFSSGKHDILHGRTSDGLPIVLGISYQYAYDPTRLYDLYQAYLGEHDRVYFNVATHLITEETTRHTAYEFFNEPQTIAERMRQTMDTYFSEHLFARVDALQINTRELPPDFNDAILESLTTKQNITNTLRYVDRMNVTLQTRLLVAEQDALVTLARAKGTAKAVLARASASANVTLAKVRADVKGFGRIKEHLSMDNADLMRYIFYDSVGGEGLGQTVGVGAGADGSPGAAGTMAEGVVDAGGSLARADLVMGLQPSILAKADGGA